MKEYENFDMIKKKFSPLLFIFRRDEENEIKKYSKKCTLVNLVKKNNPSPPKETTEITRSRPNVFLANTFHNNIERPFNTFNRFHHNDIKERGKYFTTKDMIKNRELAYGKNYALNNNVLYSKYFPTIINNNLIKYSKEDKDHLKKLEREYVIVSKVYTYIREDRIVSNQLLY
ncbi:hypothetical protein PFMALIP_00722 [Plasmodium falciparum MaliPS096_E11]|uniref:Uncharacterized protein n=1 Tax=Plasmodium falciparum MaliPS096_E11 TaxID=1036727 RepID=A0A024WWW7_PLAFA|nr:hypothetical protein PFMALIP_00722 [Plasmodium falciparum MaliPS096_E11]